MSDRDYKGRFKKGHKESNEVKEKRRGKMIGHKPYNKIRNWRSFKEARKFVHKLGLTSAGKWTEYCKSGKKPDDIPSHPNVTYKKEWKGYSDWINIRNYLSYNDAKNFLKKYKISSKSDWTKFKNGDKRPKNIPKAPDQVYKARGTWDSWGDFLGTGTIAPQDREYRSFKDARKFARSLKIKDQRNWQAYAKSDKKPDDIPHSPEKVYENKGWDGYGDWLGSGSIANQDREFMSYVDAKKFVKKFHFTQTEWHKYSKSEEKPDYIPANPARTYKKEWEGWGKFLGTGNMGVAQRSKEFLPYKEAKKVYRELGKKYGLKNHTDWVRFTKTHNKLLRDLKIPAHPQIYTHERALRMMK